MYAVVLIVYYMIKPLMIKFVENKNRSIETEAELPFEEYWKEELESMMS